MSRSRHRAVHKHTLFRRIVPAAAAAAVVAAGATVALQVTSDAPASSEAQSDGTSQTSDGAASRTTDDGRASRSGGRPDLRDSSDRDAEQSPEGSAPSGHDDGAGSATVATPDPEPAGTKYVTTELNVRTGPSEEYDVVTTLETGSKVTVTDRTDGDWAEIIHEDEARWVTAEYLANKKPEEPEEQEQSEDDSTDETTGGLSSAPCPSGSSVESGLTPDAISVHRAVCAEFPEVTSYGGLRPGDDDEHGTGQALDIMITGSTGDEIAEFLQANAGALGVSELLWEQQIWTVQRSSEGWRPFADRGSATANHYDHVHVTVYGG